MVIYMKEVTMVTYMIVHVCEDLVSLIDWWYCACVFAEAKRL